MSKPNGDEQVAATEQVPSYGLLVINHAYNEGHITFLEWLKLSREWALKIIEQYDKGETSVEPSLPLSPTCPKALTTAD